MRQRRLLCGRLRRDELRSERVRDHFESSRLSLDLDWGRRLGSWRLGCRSPTACGRVKVDENQQEDMIEGSQYSLWTLTESRCVLGKRCTAAKAPQSSPISVAGVKELNCELRWS